MNLILDRSNSLSENLDPRVADPTPSTLDPHWLLNSLTKHSSGIFDEVPDRSPERLPVDFWFEKSLYDNQDKTGDRLAGQNDGSLRDKLTGATIGDALVGQGELIEISRVGLVENGANFAVQADIARPLFDVDGTGVTIGVISDSYNRLGQAAAEVASGDLPNVTVLREGNPNASNLDEGRAMLQLIYDIAPGARLLFHTTGSTDRDLANAIRALANAGANIIVDDVGFLNAPFFQDGQAAQAVNEVVARGVAYFSAAGNDARSAYESPFRNSGIRFNPGQLPLDNSAFVSLDNFSGGVAHDFDPGPGIDVFQSFILGPNESFLVSFQWDQPFASVNPGISAANDIDIFILNAGQNRVLSGSNFNNIGDDPLEIFEFENTTGQTAEFNFLILNFAGTDPGLMRYILFNDEPSSLQFDTNSATIFGHPNATGASAVGAADYRTPTVLQPFSSAGPTPILFDRAGNRLPIPEIRQKPNIVAPDNINTTFFIPRVDTDFDGRPNFVGTSAAAPNAAAVAALMLQAAPGTTPADLYATLQRTALDIGTAGVDFDSGFGSIQADRSVGLLRVFNSNFYLAQNPDIAAAVARGLFRSPLEHFLQIGRFEGRNPGPTFSNNVYLAQNPDVAAAVARGAFRSGFEHFLQLGQIEGRNFSSLFDRNFYLTQNPDVATAVTNRFYRSGYEHFLESGQRERRNPNAFFDENFYLTQNPDVAAAVSRGAFRSGFEHFVQLGQVERRNPSFLFDTNFYLAQNSDVAAALARGTFRSAFEHFFSSGRNEGRVGR